MQQSRRPRHLHADVDFDLDESETPGIETPTGPRIMSPRAVNANSRRILNRLTDNRKLTESTEFKTEDEGGFPRRASED